MDHLLQKDGEVKKVEAKTKFCFQFEIPTNFHIVFFLGLRSTEFSGAEESLVRSQPPEHHVHRIGPRGNDSS